MIIFIENYMRNEMGQAYITIRGEAVGTITQIDNKKSVRDYAAEIAWYCGHDTVAYVDCRGYGVALADALSHFMTVRRIENPYNIDRARKEQADAN